MTSIGTNIKEIIIPHRQGNIRLKPEFLVLEDAHIQGFLLGKDYQGMYSIDMFSQYPLERFLNEFKVGQFSANLTSKQKLILLKIMGKKRPAFSIGEEPLGNIRGHYIELYLYMQRHYPPILRRPLYPESLETRK
ncbi:hypothetical protein O181_051103 [Austropuccinia psidii MF-1]|uniref:Uncharacterized protein n=1 Tax=Austropuccinia psidii MF-1 TaxID=1389203 RepID=A0A9Q3HN06_9BASI|nr:hypothetical protein [Austropuccinia psidii MF-1]